MIDGAGRMRQKKSHPTKDEIARLPGFSGYTLEQITVLETADQFALALEAIDRARVVGFDSESKPIFKKDVKSDGPHVIQLAMENQAFIIPIGSNPPIDFLTAVLSSTSISKVGFGLQSDRANLQRKFGIRLQAAIDLTGPLRALGYRQALGARAAVAVVLGQNLRKSQSISTSNWARATLQPEQLLYAADDALAALKVYQAFESSKHPASST